MDRLHDLATEIGDRSLELLNCEKRPPSRTSNHGSYLRAGDALVSTSSNGLAAAGAA
jgi:hypothetical protein